MSKRPDYEQKMEAVNWELKNRGYEIVGLHGARSAGFYNSQASRGLKYIEEKFDHIIERLDSWDANEKGIVSMRITGIGIVFDFKRYTEEEKKARSIMNKMGLGERKPEYKGRTASIFINWDSDYYLPKKGETDKDSSRAVAYLNGTDKLFEVRFDKDQTRVRFGKRISYSKDKYEWTCKWEAWQHNAAFDRFAFIDIMRPWEASQPHILKAVERQMKKIVREAEK